MIDVAVKQCSGCGEMKPLTEYHRNQRTKDGYQYNCKECQKKTRLPKRKAHYLNTRPQWERDIVREGISKIVSVSEEHGPLNFEQVSNALDYLNAKGVA